MTRIEAVIEAVLKMLDNNKNQWKNWRLDTLFLKSSIVDDCPGNYIDGEPIMEMNKKALKIRCNKVVGCRGISCKDCWNKEVEV